MTNRDAIIELAEAVAKIASALDLAATFDRVGLGDVGAYARDVKAVADRVRDALVSTGDEP